MSKKPIVSLKKALKYVSIVSQGYNYGKEYRYSVNFAAKVGFAPRSIWGEWRKVKGVAKNDWIEFASVNEFENWEWDE